MIRLLYLSTATTKLGQAEVKAIAANSAQSNARHGITGALAFNGRNFCQVLEGEPEAVHGLLEVIEADDRHSGFKVIEEKPVTSRYFGDWSMKHVQALNFDEVIDAMKH